MMDAFEAGSSTDTDLGSARSPLCVRNFIVAIVHDFEIPADLSPPGELSAARNLCPTNTQPVCRPAPHSAAAAAGELFTG